MNFDDLFKVAQTAPPPPPDPTFDFEYQGHQDELPPTSQLAQSLPIPPSAPTTGSSQQTFIPIVLDAGGIGRIYDYIRGARSEQWSDDSFREWDEFMKAGCLEERLCRLFVAVIDLKDEFRSMRVAQRQAFEVSGDLKVAIFLFVTHCSLTHASFLAYHQARHLPAPQFHRADRLLW